PWPSEPPAADQAAIDMDRVGPDEGDWEAGRGIRRDCITKRVQSGIEGATGQPQRLIRLEYRGKFHHIETTDVDERPGPLATCYALGLDERVADFPELDHPKRRRNV